MYALSNFIEMNKVLLLGILFTFVLIQMPNQSIFAQNGPKKENSEQTEKINTPPPPVTCLPCKDAVYESKIYYQKIANRTCESIITEVICCEGEKEVGVMLHIRPNNLAICHEAQNQQVEY